ncbi:dehydrase and lipid transport-domain-containing protein [Chaetomium fimeti]|uniref:Dehydrase and lipid transport-domain-containing protein n=1 Tax=Chaetomium fimeti TaxID=1854472 RepID=A0AAE0HMY7_9PEZI|nr:dehydrase and lipid transport-domain-containing protein [Chaetomium fimeti]
MAPRLPAPARRLLAKRTNLRSLPSLSQPPLPPPPPLLQAHNPQSQPTITTTTTTRPLSTTPSRPWLLSALPNLAASANGGPSPPKTLHARRLLPYPAAQVYTLIADIDSYTHFLPHCPHSRVTKWVTTPTTTAPITANTSTGTSNTSQHNPGAGAAAVAAAGSAASTPTRHPALADLTVGWGPFTQTYTSRVYCVPGSVVEAVSGSAATSIPADVLRSVGYSPSPSEEGGKMEGIFESLVTRWTVKPLARSEGEWAEVVLSVTFQFSNPALGFAAGQLADEKVDEMVEAFEGRARQLYGGR